MYLRNIGKLIFGGLFAHYSLGHNAVYAGAKNLPLEENVFGGIYITTSGIYKLADKDRFSSFCFQRDFFDGYRYIVVQANEHYATRVHILKEKPKNHNERVQYSDYYKESILVRKGTKIDIVIPEDALLMYILNSREGHRNTPDSINLYLADSVFTIGKLEELSLRNNGHSSYMFLHWNLGHFSNGQYPSSTITESNYTVKLDGFNNFFNAYCPDCHYLLNEYDETFAKVDGRHIRTDSVLFGRRKNYKVFPRSTSSGYNKLAAFWNDGLRSFRYGVFESLKGVQNGNGTLEYGTGYCISEFPIGDKFLYVMSLHAPNSIKRHEFDALCKEIISICSCYDNCILVGDFNRTTVSNFALLTDAGFSIFNDSSVTYPRKGNILDWVLYRCHDVLLSDYRVYSEAIDKNGAFLSDHFPLSFRVKVKEYINDH